MGSPRVLFVDDEVTVLDGIRGIVQKLRPHWHVEFAHGGKAALKLTQSATYDIVISDLQMPDMDGADLLMQIAQISPGTIRFILSGHTEQQAVDRAKTVAHQFLHKPFKPTVLIAAIEQALGLSGANEA